MRIWLLSRASQHLALVGRYGLPRYHGRRLVRALQSDRCGGNWGGTTELTISSLDRIIPIAGAFLFFVTPTRDPQKGSIHYETHPHR